MKMNGIKPLKNRLASLGFIHLGLLVLALYLATRFYASGLDIKPFGPVRWLGIGALVMQFSLTLLVVDMIDSLCKMKRFVCQETKQLQIRALWRETFTNPLAGILIIAVVSLGITNAQELSEVYRLNVKHWHDASLWAIEASTLKTLIGMLPGSPALWDTIYFSLWGYLMLAYALTYKMGSTKDFCVLNISAVLSFYMTRFAAINYGTKGPIFYHPEFFNVTDTLSHETQKMLLSYMSGDIAQNGFIPGTMGMPSLHVGLTFLATAFIIRRGKIFSWVAIPWCLLIWLSTIMLGWHYVLDGFGGIMMVTFAIFLSLGLMKTIKTPGTDA